MVRVGLFAGLVIAGSGEFGGVSGPGTSGLVHPLHCRGGVDVDQVCEHSELDEVFIKINGTSHYLWRAVDQHGNVLDILVTSRRDAKAATIYKSTSTPRNQALNSANSPNTWLSSPGTSAPTPTGSPTTASAAAAVRPSPPPSSSPPSTKWCPNAWSKNSRCAGHRRAPICSCRSAPRSSMTIWVRTSLAGIRVSVISASRSWMAERAAGRVRCGLPAPGR